MEIFLTILIVSWILYLRHSASFFYQNNINTKYNKLDVNSGDETTFYLLIES